MRAAPFCRRVAVALLLMLCGARMAGAHELPAGAIRGELESGGRMRSYMLHVPAAAPVDAPLPLVVALHGGGGNALGNIEQTGFDDLVDREGFIVVHPDGTGAARPLLNALGRGHLYTWNAGSCCGYAVQNRVDDVGFIRALVASLREQYPIDPKRIYATGLSNGGMMAYRLACAASDIFAAVGIVSAAQTSACQPREPVSVIHIHGSADQNVPLAGGIGPKALDRAAKPPVMDAINFWVRADGAQATPVISEHGKVRKQLYSGGRSGSEVVFYLIDGGGHAWPGGQQLRAFLDKPSQELAATPLIWEFFKAHARP